jgi:hypothetical protein
MPGIRRFVPPASYHDLPSHENENLALRPSTSSRPPIKTYAYALLYQAMVEENRLRLVAAILSDVTAHSRRACFSFPAP